MLAPQDVAPHPGNALRSTTPRAFTVLTANSRDGVTCPLKPTMNTTSWQKWWFHPSSPLLAPIPFLTARTQMGSWMSSLALFSMMPSNSRGGKKGWTRGEAGDAFDNSSTSSCHVNQHGCNCAAGSRHQPSHPLLQGAGLQPQRVP